MAYQNTSAASYTALLAIIRDFLTTCDWTINTDGSAGGTLTVTNANGHKFYISMTSTTNRTDFYTGAFTDRRLTGAYDLGNIGGTAGQQVTSAGSNDAEGPYSNVWLFGSGSYCHIVLQVAPSRYTHFSIGNLDAKGIHSTPLPFVGGIYWVFWATQANYSNSSTDGNPFNNPASGSHAVGVFLDGTNEWRCGIPAGLLDSSLDFPAGIINIATHQLLCRRFYFRQVSSNAYAALLDYASVINNHAYTGGVTVSPLPVMAKGTVNDVRAYIGDVPDVGMVNMTGLAPGQILTFADDEWMVFPIKQAGPISACKFGAAPQPYCNSAFYGLAYRKE